MTSEQRSDKLLELVERIAIALEAIAGAEAKPSVPAPRDNNPPHCPDCNVTMLLRTNKLSGEQFWGCRNFPESRRKIAIKK